MPHCGCKVRKDLAESRGDAHKGYLQQQREGEAPAGGRLGVRAQDAVGSAADPAS